MNVSILVKSIKTKTILYNYLKELNFEDVIFDLIDDRFVELSEKHKNRDLYIIQWICAITSLNLLQSIYQFHDAKIIIITDQKNVEKSHVSLSSLCHVSIESSISKEKFKDIIRKL